MENATKALLIAASVLIVIVLIAVGLRILSSTRGTTNQVENVTKTVEASIFNAQFEKYMGGNVKASEVKDLVRAVMQNNKDTVVVNAAGNFVSGENGTIYIHTASGHWATLKNLQNLITNGLTSRTYPVTIEDTANT